MSNDYSRQSNEKKRKDAVSKTKRVRNRGITIAFRVVVSLLLVSIFAVGGVAFGAYMGILDSIAAIDYMARHQVTGESSIVYDRYGNEIYTFWADENRLWVDLAEIPLHMQNAIIAIEDHRFFEHNGVDLRGTLRALYVTLTSDRNEGGSTITQQVVKNNILDLRRNTPETKIQEIFLALRLESAMEEYHGSRERAKLAILEQYLNTINLGGQLYGVQAAARFYFNKDIQEITLSEAAVLASITQFPVHYNPARFPENNRTRQVVVLGRMLAQGLITQAEFNYAYNDPVFDRISEFRIQQEEVGTVRSYFIDHLFNVLMVDLVEAGLAANRADASRLLHNGGLRIHTTKNPMVQDVIEEVYLDDSFFPANHFHIAIEYHISFFDEDGEIQHRSWEPWQGVRASNMETALEWKENTRAELLGENGVLIIDRFLPTPQPQSAFVVLDHRTGQVHGLVGGRGEKTENLAFNRATDGRRHPGSVFKMIATYAPAFDLGLMAPSSILIDQPFRVPQPDGRYWEPENWQTNFRGNNTAGGITVRHAVAQSFNRVAAMGTYNMITVDRAFQYARNFGFDLPETDRIPSIALGGLTHGVTQLEMAAAFGAMANNGVWIEPTFYTRITDHNRNLLLEATPEVRQVLRPEAAYLITSTMQDVLTQGTGGRARMNTNMAVAGKTGTSQETRDLNFAGYTPYFTASVWMGVDLPASIPHTGNPHLDIWSTIMNRIHEDLPVITRFERPPGIVEAQIDTATGLRAVPGVTQNVRTEIFDSMFLPAFSGEGPRMDILTGQPIVTRPDRDWSMFYTHLGNDPETGEDIWGLPDDFNYEEALDYLDHLENYGNYESDEDPVYELGNEQFVNPDFAQLPPTLPWMLPPAANDNTGNEQVNQNQPPQTAPPVMGTGTGNDNNQNNQSVPPQTFPQTMPPPAHNPVPPSTLPHMPTMPTEPPAMPVMPMFDDIEEFNE